MLNPHFKQSNASDKFCPRCNTKTVKKNLRKCIKCNGWLFWYGDDCKCAEVRRDAYYIWLNGIGGNEGWYYMTYNRYL